jgi:polyisoprenoid-binding protein YceI
MKNFIIVEFTMVLCLCKKWTFLIFTLLLILSSNNAIAQIYATNGGHANFRAKMPFNSYMGKSDQLQGDINFETGEVAFKLAVTSIKTDKDKRDEHMYELLETKKNPYVLFDGKLIDEFKFDKNTNQSVKVKGNFTLADVTRQIIVPINLKLTPDGAIQLYASWSLLITNYGLERPSIAFIQVNDKHDISLDAVLKE